jgi:hypothetical protein
MEKLSILMSTYDKVPKLVCYVVISISYIFCYYVSVLTHNSYSNEVLSIAENNSLFKFCYAKGPIFDNIDQNLLRLLHILSTSLYFLVSAWILFSLRIYSFLFEHEELFFFWWRGDEFVYLFESNLMI